MKQKKNILKKLHQLHINLGHIQHMESQNVKKCGVCKIIIEGNPILSKTSKQHS